MGPLSAPAQASLHLDRSSFSQTLQLLAVRVPAALSQSASKILKGLVFDKPRLRHIVPDPDAQHAHQRLVLLDPDKVASPQDLPAPVVASLQELLAQGGTQVLRQRQAGQQIQAQDQGAPTDGGVEKGQGPFQGSGAHNVSLESQNTVQAPSQVTGQEHGKAAHNSSEGHESNIPSSGAHRTPALDLVPHSITLDYAYWPADHVLKQLLPEGCEVPAAFETIGHVAHVNIREDLLPFRFLIGQVLLDKGLPRIQVVVNKVGSIENEFRVPRLEIIARADRDLLGQRGLAAAPPSSSSTNEGVPTGHNGATCGTSSKCRERGAGQAPSTQCGGAFAGVPQMPVPAPPAQTSASTSPSAPSKPGGQGTAPAAAPGAVGAAPNSGEDMDTADNGDPLLETVVRQHGASFALHYGRVYWNSRLEREHQRLVALFRPGETVLDLFAGIGPFAVPAALKGCHVYANDLNPDSVHYLRENCRRNRVAALVQVHNADARDFVRGILTPPATAAPVMTLSGTVTEADEATRPEEALTQGQSQVQGREQEQGNGQGQGRSQGKGHGGSQGQQARQGGSGHSERQTRAAAFPWEHFDHAVLNLPASSIQFLDSFRSLLSRRLWRGPMPWIHVYTFKRASQTVEDLLRDVAAQLGGERGVSWTDLECKAHAVRDVAPNKEMYCLSIRLPPVATFGGEPTEGGL